MRNESEIGRRVRRLLARRRWVLFLRTLLGTASVLSFLLAACFFAAVAFASEFFAGWRSTEVLLLGLAVLGASWALTAVAAGLWSLLVRLGPVYTAKCLDDRYGFKDQVASALDLADVEREFACAVRERAGRMTGESKPREVFPFGFPKLTILSLAAVALLVIAAVVLFREDLSAAQMQRDIAELSELLRRFAQDREKEARTEEEKELLKRLKELSERLKKEDITKKDALEEAARLNKALAQKQQELLMKGLDLRKAAEELAKCKDTKPIAEELERRSVKGAAQKTKELADAVKDRKALKENKEFEDLSQAYDRAAPYMGPFRAGSERTARASKFYERDATAEELKKLAEQMKQDAEAAELSEMLQG
jgi:hypothetical protein